MDSIILSFIKNLLKGLPLSEKFCSWLFFIFIFIVLCFPRVSLAGHNFHLSDIFYIVLFLYALRTYKKEIFPRTFSRLLIFFLITLVLSLIIAVLQGTITSPYNSTITLIKMIQLISLPFITVSFIKSQEDIVKTYSVVYLSGLYLSAVAFIEVILNPFVLRTFNNKLYLGESNHIGMVLGVAFLLVLHQILATRNKPRYIFMAIIFLACIFTTLSRTAIFFLIITVFMSAILAERRFLYAGILLTIFAMTITPAKIRFEYIFSEVRIFFENLERKNAGYPPKFSYSRNRLENWFVALSESKINPVTGLGLGARHRIFYENFYVSLFSEGGAISLLLFLLILGYVFRKALGTNRFIFFVLVFISLCGLTSVSFLINRVATLFWILTGILFLKETEQVYKHPQQ